MRNLFESARLNEVLISAKHCRMRQLETDFARWEEYVERVEEKDLLMKSLEKLLSNEAQELLRDYDDAYSIMVCKAQDYFYEQGFYDCLRLIRMVIGEAPEPKASPKTTHREHKHRNNPAENIVFP